ncbi:MAG: ABC transporter permease [Legionellales bacterium]|nr:ABC transporter permease [Legionellales bacterium]
MSTKETTTPIAHPSTQSFLSHQMTACYTIAYKESVRIVRIWKMTVVPPIVTVFLFSVVFGQIIGGKIGGISGVSYLQFIIPGLIMNIVINESFNNNASSIMIDKYNKSIESMVTAPVHELTILFGYFAGCVVRVLMAGAISSVLVFWLAGIMVQHWFLFTYTILITCALFSFLGFINGLYATRFDEIPTIPTFILTPLSFFGGVFYDITTLPEPWRTISWYNPIVYIVDTFRYSTIGVTHHDITESLIVVTAITSGLFFLSYCLLRTGYGLKN